MDHQVEDDVDVERAGCEDAEPVGLKEHGTVEVRQKSLDGGVEALQMPDLENAVFRLGHGDEAVGFGEGAGDGLLDQDMEAGCECVQRDGGVGAGGGADGDSVEL